MKISNQLKRPIVISYYTRDTGYEIEVKRLISSLRRFNLEYDIEGIENLGNWQKNTHYKASFIKKMLEKHKRAVLFIDADAEIKQYPFFFNELDKDFACYFRDYSQFPRSSRREGKELLTGTLYFADTKAAHDLIDAWIKENEKNPNLWEQKNLERAFNRQICQFTELSPQYCKIYDLMRSVKNPIIEHYQASRRLKNA